MLSNRALWFCWVGTMALVGACTSSNDACAPACREGFVCVQRACLSACNPVCTASERCVRGATGAYRCQPDDGGAGDGAIGDATDSSNDVMMQADGVVVFDVVPTDSDGAVDVPSGSDGSMMDSTPPDGSGLDGSAMDAPRTDGPRTDAPSGDVPAGDAAPTCGTAGLACCGSAFCMPGLECASGTCRAFTPMAGECSRPSDCPAGQVCSGPTTCGSHGCFRCVAATGTAAFGAACAANTDCASGVCRGSVCTVACPLGASGDSVCNSVSAGAICSQLNYTVGPMGMTTTVALGYCRRGCRRNADCASPEVCVPLLNYVTDRMDFVCGRSSATGLAGTNCMSGSECQSFLCVPGSGTMGLGACTAPCVTATDCPASASMCLDLTWLRPSGGSQPGRGCLPR